MHRCCVLLFPGSYARSKLHTVVLVLASAAGDWHAAALALGHLSKDVQHQQQLLVVRLERAASKDNNSAAATADRADSSQPADAQKPAGRKVDGISLRQELQLHSTKRYAGLARSAADPVDSVR